MVNMGVPFEMLSTNQNGPCCFNSLRLSYLSLVGRFHYYSNHQWVISSRLCIILFTIAMIMFDKIKIKVASQNLMTQVIVYDLLLLFPFLLSVFVPFHVTLIC